MLKRGFTLIEILVAVAIIVIVSGAVIVGINPQKRIEESLAARARSDARSVGSAIESCMAYADPSTGVSNTDADCNSFTSGSLAGTTKGGPFIRLAPSNVVLTVNGTKICANAKGKNPTGANYEWYTYNTATGVVTSPAAGVAATASPPSCP